MNDKNAKTVASKFLKNINVTLNCSKSADIIGRDKKVLINISLGGCSQSIAKYFNCVIKGGI